MNPIRISLAAAVLAISTAAGASTEVYDVDPAYREEVYQILRRLLDTEHAALSGRVERLPNGQLLVDTNSESRQGEIASILESIASNPPGETPTVTLQYWILHGVPGGSNASGFPATLESVVRELEAVHGRLGLEIIDAASVSSLSGRDGWLRNDRWSISQEAGVAGDRVNAHISIEHELQRLSVELSLRRGEFVVLGAGTSDRVAEDGVLALVVSWPDD